MASHLLKPFRHFNFYLDASSLTSLSPSSLPTNDATSAITIANPRPDTLYIPYNYTTLTWRDVLISPFLDNYLFIITVALFFVFVQIFFAPCLLSFIFQYNYTKRMTRKEKTDACTRICAIVNALFSLNGTVMFFRHMIAHKFVFHNYMYEPIEGYNFTRYFFVGYFLWDIIICIYYKWGITWTMHALCSFLGCYFISFPYSEQYASYFGALFEPCNIFLHTSILLRTFIEKEKNSTIDDGCDNKINVIKSENKHEKSWISSPSVSFLAIILEGIFFILYIFFRVIGGTIVTTKFTLDSIEVYKTGRAHSVLCIIITFLNLFCVMLLQYVWLVEILKKVYFTFSGNKGHNKEKDKYEKVKEMEDKKEK